MQKIFKNVIVSLSSIAMAASLIAGIGVYVSVPSRVINSPTVIINTSTTVSALPTDVIIIRK